MIVSSDHFNNSSETKSITMNCGLQYDTRHPALFSGGLNMESSWMSHALQTNVKQEPSEDNFEFPKKDQSVGFTSPLTPPGINSAFTNYPTPQSDYPSVSSPSGTYSKQGPGGAQDSTPRSDGKSSPRLTPPGSIPSPLAMDISDKHDNHEGSQSSNSENEFYENGDSLRRLQMALQRTGMMPEEKLQCPMCDFSCHVRSQFNEHLVSHETKCVHCDYEGDNAEKLREHLKTVHDCEEDMWMEEEPGLKIPKVNSQGKVKTFRCKQCEFSAVTKLEFWEHSRSHIKQERLLTCPKCPFVTEYKHHLEYHLRNHFGSKPFKCDKCSYSCVNKSMLNSHLKSHSNVYQFRCSDCTYATKYCHSLKLHLRKYNHSPAMVLNPDGSPNPLPIVDVYGTKRGPKQKSKNTPEKPSPSQQPPVTTAQTSGTIPGINFTALNFNPFNLLPAQMPYYNVLNGFPSFPFTQDARVEEKNNNVEKLPDIAIPEVVMDEEEPKDDLKAPLDLTCSNEKSDPDAASLIETPIAKSRRKGKAFKLERISRRPSSDEEPEQIVSKPDLPYPEDSKSPVVKSCEADSEQQKTDKDKPEGYNCTYCDISFKDIVMYTMHMGYHGYQDPFTCNMCGQQTTDKVSFFLHIARTSHS